MRPSTRVCAALSLPLALAALGCAGDPPPSSLDAATDAATDGLPVDGPPAVTCHVADAAWLPDLSQYLIVSTTGRILLLDAGGALVSNRAVADYPGLVAACGGSAVGCQIDAVTWRSATERFVVINGAIHGLDAAMTTAGTPLPLASIPGAVAGPCAGVTGVCHLDGLVWREELQQFLAVAQGNVYTIAAAGNLVATSSLRSIPALAAGACATQTGPCRVDALTYRAPVYHYLAGDYLWNIDGATGASGGSAPLTDFAGLASICQ